MYERITCRPFPEDGSMCEYKLIQDTLERFVCIIWSSCVKEAEVGLGSVSDTNKRNDCRTHSLEHGQKYAAWVTLYSFALFLCLVRKREDTNKKNPDCTLKTGCTQR